MRRAKGRVKSNDVLDAVTFSAIFRHVGAIDFRICQAEGAYSGGEKARERLKVRLKSPIAPLRLLIKGQPAVEGPHRISGPGRGL